MPQAHAIHRTNRSRVISRRPLLPVQSGLALSVTFDADGLTLNAGAVAAARNLVGDGSGGFAQSTGVSQPLAASFVRGARTAARFDGSNDILVGASLTAAIAVPFDLFAVAKITTNRNYGRIIGSDGTGLLGLDCDAAGNVYLYNGTIANFAVNDNQWHVFYARFNGASSLGAVDRGRLVACSPGTTVTSVAGFTVGGSLGAKLAGDVGEVHAFSRTLQDVERRACIDTLMARWGLR